MKGFVGGYYTFSLWVTRFAFVNMLWATFTLFGLIAFGFFPATVAMFSVVRKWVLGDKDVAIFSVFWDTYRKEFFRANILGLVLFIIGYLLSLELQILRSQDSIVYIIASYGVIAIFILYAILLLYFFPIFSHFELKALQYIKWPLIIGIIHPILTVFLILGVFFINYLAYITIPALLFFFCGSVSAFIVTWGVSKTFSKYERVV